MVGEDGDVPCVVADIIYEKLIPNSTREDYNMTRVLDNRSSLLQGPSEAAYWCSGGPSSTSWSTTKAQCREFEIPEEESVVGIP